jgi:hypothetical protein
MKKMLRPQRSTQRHRGQSLVELAVLLPVLTLILLGTVDLARAFFAYEQLTNAIREGAAFGATAPGQITNADDGAADPNNIMYRIQAEGPLDLSSTNITVICYQGTSSTPVSVPSGKTPGDCHYANTGDSIAVTGTSRFYPITTQIIRLLPSNFSLRKTIRMVI